jgi:hypothetical protein
MTAIQGLDELDFTEGVALAIADARLARPNVAARLRQRVGAARGRRVDADAVSREPVNVIRADRADGDGVTACLK